MPADPSARIAATARVHPGATIGPGVEIGEYAVIEDEVVIGAATRLEPYVYVKRWTSLGERNQVSAGACLGTAPLDKAFDGQRSYLRIGDDNIIREHFTISRGTKPDSATEIGDRNYIMTAGHIAHNCKIGSDAVICSGALVGGYVEIEDGAFLSGSVAVHQFSRIGRLAMISGHTRVNRDAPPFFLYAGSWIAPHGLNLVGLRRAGFSAEDIHGLKRAYRLLYRSKLKLAAALAAIETEVPGVHARRLVEFIRRSERGICREESRFAVE